MKSAITSGLVRKSSMTIKSMITGLALAAFATTTLVSLPSQAGHHEEMAAAKPGKKAETTPEAMKVPAGWSLAKEGDGIRVYTKKEDGRKYNSYRIYTTVKAGRDAVIQTVLNGDQLADKVRHFKESKILEQNGMESYSMYLRMKTTIGDRDIVSKGTVVFNDDGSAVTEMVATPKAYPQQKGAKRIETYMQRWTMVPVSADKVMLMQESYTDPKPPFFAPSGLVNSETTNQVFDIMTDIRAAMEDAHKQMVAQK